MMLPRSSKWVSALLVTLWLAGPLSARVASATTTEAGQGAACSADALLTGPDQSVYLLVEPRGSAQASWSSDVGSVKRDGARWQWTLTNAEAGIHRAEFRAQGAATTAPPLCGVDILVVLPAIELRNGTGPRTMPELLTPDERELPGFGLYSYIILGAPDAANRERHLRLIEAYLNFPDAARLERYLSRIRKVRGEEVRRTLNATSLLVTERAPETIIAKWNARDFRSVAEWILGHYDHARAQALFRRMGRNMQRGPYIISSLSPLGDSKTSELLLQDQSPVPATLVELWVKEFLFQSAQEKSWERRSVDAMAGRVRTMVAAAEGPPALRNAMGGLITWTTLTKAP